jgi:hypothetical protein
MIQYRPLNVDDEEIRVVTLHAPGASALLECSLEHVSLCDYSPEYRTFLQLERGLSIDDRAMLWDLVTNDALTFEDVNNRIPANGLVRTALTRFSNDAVYQQGSFVNARRYSWGDFSALSYEWGDLSHTAEIMVNGNRTRVTYNLEAALRGLRQWWHQEHRDGRMRIWIDALCINQQDIPERNAQVKRMKSIYSDAFCVLAWTGGPLEAGQEATIALLRQLSSMVFESPEVFEDKVELLLTPENNEAWKGLVYLACRPYWQRLWIIQEIILANPGARICFGEHYALAAQYFKAVSALLEHSQHVLRLFQPDLQQGISGPFAQALDRCDRFRRLYSFKFAELPHPPLSSLLATGRTALQSDTRDKVYGLLGLMDPRIIDAVIPDYNKSMLEVYYDFAIGIIRSTGRLETLLLQGAVDYEQSVRLPSWVPDWSLDPSSNPDVLTLGHYRDIYFGDFKASGETLHVFRPGKDTEHLFCRGLRFDTIDGLGCSKQANDPHDDHDTVLPTAADDIAQRPYQSSETPRETFWKTFTLGSRIPSNKSMAFINDLPFFDGEGEDISYFHVIDRFQSCNQDLAIGETNLPSIFPQWTSRFEELPDDEDIMSNIIFLMLTMVYRRFAITNNGYMALCPKKTQKGDGVYILRGCSVPLILRPTPNGTFFVVGECFVQGIMNGEAMEGLSRNEFEEVGIVIH